ncbi:MAG: 2-oxoglutarate and iron-dependent oxygenase domain-containing protein [Flavobacteriales bacterium]|nr:2-oxoglutarate and iron-dependent oxygenase domain-containing protein [Flavobacteriales bacterium]MDG1779861.1 2-oxoglutarate and iron-dependent oxygenase domain-containing protein [Flavobacteriales bacterium]MDG2246264.1 2-oxoglutarate and iron-dependent oxygenase domain-containing protein [Flavobacteriales bacterium]
MNDSVMGIPSVDLADYLSNDAQRKENFVNALGAAYENIGFVAVKNHMVSDQTVEQLYAKVQSFFTLPEDTKLKYEIEGLAGQRGYTSFGKEHAKDSNAGDLKEFWHFGQEVTDGDPIKSQYPDNVDVPEVEGFFGVGIKAYQELEDTGRHMLRAIATFLGLDVNYFDDKINNGNSILRPIHYPPITNEPKSAVRAGQHEDINLITLLIGASAEGLQVLNKQNEWVAVTALPDHIIVNVGDMLQRLTNNRLKSTTHRVVNPPREKWGQSRFSIPFFLHPRSEMRLDCLASCIEEGKTADFEPISAGEYLDQRLAEIGLKK